MALPFLLRSLRNRQLKLFFTGQSLSLIGTWITTVASSWLVYRLTESELWLGIAAISTQLPTAVLSPLAGVVADRYDRRKLLLVTQSLSLLQSLALAVLTGLGIITVPQILVLNVFQGILNAFDLPARQSMFPSLLEDKIDLTNAIALNAAMFHGARLVGPSIAGLLLAFFDEAVCFGIDVLSYGAVIYCLLLIRPRELPRTGERSALVRSFRSGVEFALSHPSIRLILSFVPLFALFGTPQITLLPVFAREVLGGGASTYGFLMACSGLGAMSGALFLASQSSHGGLARIVAPTPLISSAMLLLLAASTNIYLSALALCIAGASMVTLMAGCNTMLQVLVPDELRGRVLSFYALSFMGMMPLCGFLAGLIAHRYSAPVAVAVGGLSTLGLSLAYFVRLRSLPLPP